MAGDLQIQKLSQNVIQWLEISKCKSFHKMLSNGWRSPNSKAFTKCYPMAGDLQIQTFSRKCYSTVGDLQAQKVSKNVIQWSEICLITQKNVLKKTITI